jgi:demethylmenaquinone methyltransferase / 2-methoxy-6-polyprenyl-1,4-benzoquinol methylase
VYSRLAPIYDVWGWFTESKAHARAFDAAQLNGSERVLEVAVGSGELYVRICAALTAGRAAGMDLSRGMIGRTHQRMVRHQSKGALCLADALSLPFASESFDVLFNCFMLDLLPEEKIPVALDEFRRVLKPDGRLVLLTMMRQTRPLNAIWMWLYRWSPELLGGCRPVATAAYLAAAGWQVERHEEISQVGIRSKLHVARPAKKAA